MGKGGRDHSNEVSYKSASAGVDVCNGTTGVVNDDPGSRPHGIIVEDQSWIVQGRTQFQGRWAVVIEGSSDFKINVDLESADISFSGTYLIDELSGLMVSGQLKTTAVIPGVGGIKGSSSLTGRVFDELVRFDQVAVFPPCPEDQNVVWDNCFGSLTWANGDKYVGEFRDGERNGVGTMVSPNGTLIHGGLWLNGEPVTRK